MTSSTFRCFVMGNESLLVQCAELILGRGHLIEGVITSEPGVEAWATKRGLRVLAPGMDLEARLGAAPFDWLFSIANLSIIPDGVLRRATKGAINFHDGPLPTYAGLNAPTWALLAGETTHGITWHLIEGGVDEGDILAQSIFDLAPDETALTLNTKCYAAAIETFSSVLDMLGRGDLDRRRQDLGARTYFAKAKRPEGCATLDFTRTRDALTTLCRALDYGGYANPLAVPKIVVGGRAYLAPSLVPIQTITDRAPGTVVAVCTVAGVDVACADGVVRLARLTLSNGESVDPKRVLSVGDRLTAHGAEDRATLTTLHEAVARHEDFFRKRLASLDPLEAPLTVSSAGSTRIARVEVPLPVGTSRDTALAAGLATLARLGGKTVFDVALSSDALRARIAGFDAYFADAVPLRFVADETSTLEDATRTITEALTTLTTRETYARDLVARRPEIPPVSLPVGVLLTASPKSAAPIADAAFTLAFGDTSLVVAYDVARVSAAMAAELGRRLEVFCANATGAPTRPLTSLPLMTAVEREKVVFAANQTDAQYEPDLCVHQAFERQVDRTPDDVALVFESTSFTYRALDEAANRVAHVLREEGIGPDALVGLYVKRGPSLVIGALAIQKAGGAYVPLDPSYPPDRVALMLADSGAKVLLTEAASRSDAPTTSAAVVVIDADPRITAASTGRTASGVRGEHLAYVIYTSGSTGKPKGVMVEHRNVSNFFVGMDDRIKRPRDQKPVWLAVTSLSFDISVLELFYTLARGYTVVISSDEDRALVAGAQSRFADRPIGFSLFYFASDEGETARDKYRLLLEGSKYADQNGFDAVWTPERHFHAFGGLYPNPSVASAAIAVLTERVRIRAGSCVLPLHHPARVAEEWALVDNLSNGRVELSFAAGWQPNDFVFKPENFADAKGAMARDIDVVRSLWRGEAVTFDGPKGPVSVRTLPRPVQPELPFFVTAAGNPETFALAGTMGASILTHLLGQSVEELESKIRVYREARKAAGHPGEGHVALMLHSFVGDDADVVKARVREPMKAYLRSSMELIKQHAWSFPAFKKAASADISFSDNFSSLTNEDREALLDHSFERYYETSGLFGTPASCVAMVDRLKGVGVDEIACLVDFGIDSETVLSHLPHLTDLKARVTPSTQIADDDFSIAAQLVRHQVTHLQCTPSMARMLVMNGEAKKALRTLELFMLGGEALPGALVREIKEATGAAIENMYGPTETTIWSSTERAQPVEGVVSIGTPITNTQLYVLDPSREPLPIGVPGELYIGGDGVTRGYLHRPDLTSERFVPDPFREGGRMYATGDLVRRMPDGRIDFLGRVDFQVKIRGYRIELGEIESRIAAVPGVRECVVVAREDVPGDKRLVAYVTTAPSGASVETMRSALEAELPSYMVPAHFVVLERFPLTPNAKVDRKALPKPDVALASKAEYVVPAGQTEEAIAAVFARLLGLARVGVKDNFFELGGHSLLAVQAHREIKEAVGAEMTITDLFRFPTVGALSAHLDSGGNDEAELAKTADRASARRDALNKRRGAVRPRA